MSYTTKPHQRHKHMGSHGDGHHKEHVGHHSEGHYKEHMGSGGPSHTRANMGGKPISDQLHRRGGEHGAKRPHEAKSPLYGVEGDGGKKGGHGPLVGEVHSRAEYTAPKGNRSAPLMGKVDK